MRCASVSSHISLKDLTMNEKNALRTSSLQSTIINNCSHQINITSRSKRTMGRMKKICKSTTAKLLDNLPGKFIITNCISRKDDDEKDFKDILLNLTLKQEKFLKICNEKQAKEIVNSVKELKKLIVNFTQLDANFVELALNEIILILKNSIGLFVNFKKAMSLYKKEEIETHKKINKETECNFLKESNSLRKLELLDIESLKRMQILEKEQLLEKIELLESHIKLLNEKYENKYLENESQKIKSFETIKNNLLIQCEKSLKDKDRSILRLQFQLSECQKEIIELNDKNKFEKQRSIRSKISLSQVNKICEIVNEKNRELSEQVLMITEELRNYLNVKVILQRTQDQLKNFQRRFSITDSRNKIDFSESDELQVSANFSDKILLRMKSIVTK